MLPVEIDYSFFESIAWPTATAITFLFSLLNLILLFKHQSTADKSLRTKYTLYVGAIAFWSGNNFLFSITGNEFVSYCFSQLLHMGAILIPILLLDFVHLFFQVRHRIFKIELTVGYILSGFFISSLILYPHEFIQSLSPKRTFLLFPNAGPIYQYWVIVFFYLIISAHMKMMFKYLVAPQLERKKLAYFVFPSMIAYIGCLSYFLPIYDIYYPPYPWGSYFSAALPFIFGYGIIRYRLLGIDLIIKKTIVFASLLAFSYGVISFFVILSREIFERYAGWPSWIATLVSVTTVVLTLRPLDKYLTALTDKYLFQKKFDYKEILKRYIEEVVVQLDLEKVLIGTKGLIENTIRPEKFEIYLFNQTEASYIEQYERKEIIPMKTLMMEYLRHGKRAIDIHASSLPQPVQASMRERNWEIIIPLTVRQFKQNTEDMIGFMALAKRKSDEVYSKDDMDVLHDLASVLAVAITNALTHIEMTRAETLAQLGVMADSMSHQFNNRFNTTSAALSMVDEFIIPETQEVLDSTDKSQEEKMKAIEATFVEIQKSIKIARESVIRGGEIAKALLTHNRPDKQKKFEVIDITKTVDLGIMFAGFRYKDEIRAVKIEQDFAPEVPRVWTSPAILQEIYIITLANAIEAILRRKSEKEPQMSGHIVVAIRFKPESKIIRLEIRDNGIGMKPKELEAVRAGIPFFTTKGSSSEKSGFGAGVHTLKKYVDMLDGRLDYESEYMKGTSCIIDFPARDKAPE